MRAAVLTALVGLAVATPGGATGQAAADSTAPSDTASYRAAELRVRIMREDRPLSGVAAPVSALHADSALAMERGTSLADAVRSVPGLFVQDRRNASLGDRITVRGSGARAQFGVRGLRVLTDGISLTLPDGQSTLSNLDLLSAGSIEVLRGPASTLYGNAAGGVIAVRTRLPDGADRPLRPSGRLVAGSHGLLQSRLEAAGSLGSARIRLSGERLETDGFREHSAAEIWRGNAVGALPFSGGELRAVGNVYHTPFAENPSSLDRETARERPREARDFIVGQGAGERATQVQGGLSWEGAPGRTMTLRLATWGLTRDLRNPIPERIVDLERLAAGARAELHAPLDLVGRPVRWTVGLDLETQRDRRRELENLGVPSGGGRSRSGDLLLEQDERVLGTGAFLRGEMPLGAGWRVSGAGRLDLYRFRVADRLRADGDDSGTRTFVALSPAAAVAWSAAPALELWGRVATAFQTPTTSELSNRPDGSGGFHPDLEPERLLSFELGGRARAGAALSASVALYHARVRDALVPFEGATGEVFFRNAGRVERSGVELAVDWTPVPRLSGTLAWTAARSRFVSFRAAEADFAGNREPGVPDQRLVLSTAYRTAVGIRTEAVVRWVDAYPVNDANTAWNGSYRVVDLRASWERPGGLRVRPFVGVDNAFGERYNGSVVPNAFGGRYYEPAPGRELYGGVDVPLF